MKTIKVRNILSECDLEDNYIALYDKNGKFNGFVERNKDNEMFSVTFNNDYDVYDSLEELLSNYQEGTIKIISIEEMSTFMQSLLNTTKDENN